MDVGIAEDGYELQFEHKWETIEQSDAYGDSIIDGVWRGGNAYIQYLGLAYKPGSITPFYPWGANIGEMQVLGTTPIGRLASAVASAFVLTATGGSPAAIAAAPATLTAAAAIMAPNSPARLLFTTRLRKVPTRLLCLPTVASSVVKWFSMT